VRQERLKRRILEDIQRQLAQLLADKRIGGRLELSDTSATLRGDGQTRHVSLGDLPAIWHQLAPAQRVQRLAPLADALVGSHAPPFQRGAAGTVLAVLALVALTAGLGLAVLRGLADRKARDLAAQQALQPVQDADRSQRVCEATRSRVMRGGTAGPTDYEGWVVELSLVAPQQQEPDLSAFFAPLGEGFGLVWPQAPEVLRKAEPGTISLIEHRSGDLLERRYVLSGGFAKTYFDEIGRLAWVRLASAAFVDSSARFGALYARCEHQTSHHIGSWFGGANVADSAAALLHFAGVFSETAVYTKRYLPAKDVGRPELTLLDAFAKRASDLDRTQLAMWLSEDAGTVAGKDGERITMGFPFKDSNRASRASLRIARRLEIANTR